MRRRLAFGVFLLLIAGSLFAGSLQDKNYLVLTLLEKTPADLESDPDLKEILQAKQDALRTCADVACFASKMRFTDEEISRAAAALKGHHASDAALRTSGAYKGDLDAAWRDAALGINHVIDVYGAGTPPRYPQIDSVSYDVKSEQYAQLVQTVADRLNEESQSATLFFQPSLRFALYLLQINRRDEAARYEPLEKGENAAALRKIRTISWNKYPYTLILVPGYGPEKPEWNLAPEGKLRLEMAVRRFNEHKAPFIVVSGGHVHPNQTPYCEAIEMKKSLVDDFDVPADRIIVEPHARHTTTNLRNVARLMHRYGIPFDRKALITTDRFQSTYIEGETFAKRCNDELGYQPVRLLGRVSIFDLEFTPQMDSLLIDAMSPLDP